jgi:hypothetical protein
MPLRSKAICPLLPQISSETIKRITSKKLLIFNFNFIKIITIVKKGSYMKSINNFVINTKDSVNNGESFKKLKETVYSIKEKLGSDTDQPKRIFIPKTFGRSFAKASCKYPVCVMVLIADRITNTVEYCKNGHSNREKVRKWSTLSLKVAALSLSLAASFIAVPVSTVVTATKAIANYKKENAEE